jgi:glutathione S-transferase
VNPRGLLPTLELDDGTRIDETIAICRYIEETHPEPNLMGSTALEKAVIESWQRHMEFDGMLAVGEMFRNSFPAFSNRGVPGAADTVKAIPELEETNDYHCGNLRYPSLV